jgi:hypothetical protein
VSILVEIAEKADVSVEGVVRVLTREPVSEAVKERVLAVLDDLTPEQTRAVQRFALAALHDVLLRPGDAIDFAAAPAADDVPPALPPAPTGSEAAFVQLGSVLGELAEAVRDLRRETDAERRERVDDLAVLIDLITTGWQGLDARLGRIEKQVSRLEAGRREPALIASARVVPPAVEPAAAPIEPQEPGGRRKLPIVATLSLVGAAIATLAVLQLASGGSPDVSRLVSSRESPTTAAGEAGSTASAPSSGPTSTRAETRPAATTARPSAQSPTRPATTSDVLGTSSGATVPSKPPAATTRPATTAASPPGFQPTRSWAWAPVKNAAYYDVVFTRSGKVFYAGSPTAPRLTLPSSLVFRPGAYRWVVRPGFGDRAAKNLGPPVVDSPFTVA